MNNIEKDLIKAIREAPSDICETMRNIFFDIMNNPEHRCLFADDNGRNNELGSLVESFKDELLVDGILKFQPCTRQGSVYRLNTLVTDTERSLIKKVKEASPDDCLMLSNLLLEMKEKNNFYDSFGYPTQIGLLANAILNELSFNGRLKIDFVPS